MKVAYYLSTPDNAFRAVEDTELSACELEEMVGRFPDDHHRWPGQLRGQVWLYPNKVQVRHHFTKAILFESHFDMPVFY